MTREGDYVYGRGTTDDKGPVMEALYAMKLLRDSGVKLNKRVRLIMGCNEENGSRCMEHYNEVAEELSCGFTPDANLSLIHIYGYYIKATEKCNPFFDIFALDFLKKLS